jgi:ribose transport system permease protein
MNETSATVSPTPDRPAQPLTLRGIRLLGSSTALWVFVVDIVLVLVFGAISPQNAFLSTRSFQAIGLDAAAALILATGIALLLGAAEIDLSVGANLLLSSVVGGKVMASFGTSSPGLAAVLGLLACVGTGAVVGLANGLIVTRLRVVSLIATLATLGIATGIANIVTGGTDITGLPAALQNDFGIRTALGIPLPAFVAFGVWLIALALFRTTRYGMRILALGSNRGAAERAGLRVSLHLVVTFAVIGMLAGLAGFIDLTRFVVVGLSPFYQLIAIGVVLIAAVSLDQRRRPAGMRLRLLR